MERINKRQEKTVENFYFAPLEGISGYVYRKAYEHYFGGIDKYFIPFIKPNQKGKLSAREKSDILPENNRGMRAIPQILTNSAEDFIKTAKKLKEYGYDEINLNLGCPSKTVVSKGRGSGFLAEPDRLRAFLEEIFEKTQSRISIKTRIGKESPEEFFELLEIYNQYPMEELIIHPRIQTDFYKHTPNLAVFEYAVKHSRNRLCYNGDICTKEEYEQIRHRFPEITTVMIGRGILKNPGLVLQIRQDVPVQKDRIRAFHDELYEEYQEVLFGEKTVLFKMKELWFYMAPLFTQYEKYAKKIKKAEKLKVYEEIVDTLFEEQDVR